MIFYNKNFSLFPLRWLKWTIAFCWCALLCGRLPAQPVVHLTARDGLSQGFVASVLQGSDGFIWIATLNGLNRYDGKTVSVFRHRANDPYSLPGNFVFGLAEDSARRLWVLTDCGMCVLDRRTGRFHTVVPVKQGAREPQFPNQLVEDTHGRLWYFAGDSVVCLEIAPGATLANGYADGLRLRQYAVAEDLYGEICNIAPGDTALYIAGRLRMAVLPFNDLIVRPFPLPLREPAQAVWRDGLGAWWFQGEHSASRLSDGHWETYPTEIMSMRRNWRGITIGEHVYVFSNQRIYRWSAGEWEILPLRITEEILSAALDAGGMLWIGTNARGVLKLRLDQSPFTLLPHSYAIGLIKSAFSEAARRLEFNHGFRTRDGHVWAFCADSLLCVMDDPAPPQRCYPFNKEKRWATIMAMERRDGRLVFPSGRLTLAEFDRASGTMTYHSLRRLFTGEDYTASVTNLLEMPDGTCLVATTRGLVDVSRSADGTWGEPRPVFSGRHQAGLSDDHILCMIADPADPEVVWIGTQRGLNRFDRRAGVVRSFTQPHLLPNDVIYSILPTRDGRYLWLGTNVGLLEFDRLTYAWRHFTESDGVPSHEFNSRSAWYDAEGAMLFGSVDGTVQFDPDRIPRPTRTARMVVTELSAANRILANWQSDSILYDAVYANRPIELNYEQRGLSVRFALCDFLQPDANRYQYRLGSTDSAWVDLGNETIVRFSNLAPGRYVLALRGRSRQSAWSDPVTFSFVIRPPWWQTWWARLGFLLAAAALLAALAAARLYHLRLRDRFRLQQREAVQQAGLQRAKAEFYTNFTHEVRTPLTVILGLADQLEEELQEPATSKAALIARNGRELLQTVNQVLDLERLDSQLFELAVQPGNLRCLLHDLGVSFGVLAAIRQIQLDVHLPDGPVWLQYDAPRVRAIVSNLLSNAVKFTPGGGRIVLELTIEAGFVTISVRDTGIGVAPEHQDLIFRRYYQVPGVGAAAGGTGIGLAFARELAGRMGGQLLLESEPGQGSVFRLVLPAVVVENPPADPAHIDTDLASLGTVPLEAGVDANDKDDDSLPLVLVVEDHAGVANFVMNCLAGRFRTRWAPDGTAGLQLVREILPDIVLTDVMMPGLSGQELCAALKAEPATAHIPVVMLTARAEPGQRREGLQYGADAYLTKPFQRDELLAQLENLLRLRAAVQVRYRDTLHAPAEPAASVPDPLVAQVFEVIRQRFSDAGFGAAELQREVNLSTSHFHRKMTALTGRSPGQLLRQYRLEQGRRLLLEQPELTVAEIAYRVGFNDPNHFSRAFAAEYDAAPTEFRTRMG